MTTIKRVAVLTIAFLLVDRAAHAGDGRAGLTGHGFAPVNGTRLYYEVRGTGEPLVLIHGGMLDSRMWDDQIGVYTKTHRVLRYDVRGFGGSVRPPDQGYSDADDLASLLDYLEMPEVHLVGLSLGGRIALDFVVTRPERVRSLVLAGAGLAGYDKPDPEGDERMWMCILAARDHGSEKATDLWLKDPYMAPAMENPRLAKRLRHLALENAYNWLENPILQRSPQPPAAKRLGDVKAPTLVILGARDVPRAHAIGDALLKGIKGSKKVVIPKAGHMVNMENPVDFNRAALEFLKQLAIAQPSSGK